MTRDAVALLLAPMEIESIRHKALRTFAETGRAKGLPGNLIDRLRERIAYLGVIETVEELGAPPNYGATSLRAIVRASGR